MRLPLVMSKDGSGVEPADVFGNGRLLLLLVLLMALLGVTLLGALRDIDGSSVVAIYSAIIGGAIGHANGNLQGRLAAERDRLLVERNQLRTQMPQQSTVGG